ncbi:MAG TPA: NADH-quinone oxidoreductase subunit C [Candidatus Binatia bacterium]|nr:NADH-quinone oxidoreductase subunit C [Candidatus Binatia bacterium]
MAEIDLTIPYLREKFAEKIVDSHAFRGDETIVVSREGLREFISSLKEDAKLEFDFLTDLTAVDFLGKKEPRFEVVYHLYSFRFNRRLRVKVPVPDDEPFVESLTPLWKGANWLEREVWDMFGIRFEGHPDLRRILLYEEFQGYPLRKDYPVNQWQPLVPEREVQGTFVDQRSRNKLMQLQQKIGAKG